MTPTTHPSHGAECHSSENVQEKPTLFVSFSGGRTSAYMVDRLLSEYRDHYSFVILFANTGQEHDETLEFVRKCDERWGGIVIWLEAVVHPEKGEGTRYRVVSYETCTRRHQVGDETPFAQVIKKYGIPGPTAKQICTRELKGAPMAAYRRDWEAARSSKGNKVRCLNAIGIRTDEVERRLPADKMKKFRVVYPLLDWFPADKADVLDFWESQPFDLGIPEHYGNCVTCWKKSDAKHVKIILVHPEFYDFFRKMEKEHPQTNNKPGHADRRFFRLSRTVDQMFQLAHSAGELPPETAEPLSGGCSESCEAATEDTLFED